MGDKSYLQRDVKQGPWAVASGMTQNRHILKPKTHKKRNSTVRKMLLVEKMYEDWRGQFKSSDQLKLFLFTSEPFGLGSFCVKLTGFLPSKHLLVCWKLLVLQDRGEKPPRKADKVFHGQFGQRASTCSLKCSLIKQINMLGSLL